MGLERFPSATIAGKMRDWPNMGLLSLPTRSSSPRRLSDRPPTPGALNQKSKILASISKSEEMYDEDKHEKEQELERQGSPKTKKKKEKYFYVEKKDCLCPKSMLDWQWSVAQPPLRRCNSAISVEIFGPRNERWEDAVVADQFKRRSSWQWIKSSLSRKKSQVDVRGLSTPETSREGSKGNAESRRTTIVGLTHDISEMTLTVVD